jgi:hypothetical protein
VTRLLAATALALLLGSRAAAGGENCAPRQTEAERHGGELHTCMTMRIRQFDDRVSGADVVSRVVAHTCSSHMQAMLRASHPCDPEEVARRMEDPHEGLSIITLMRVLQSRVAANQVSPAP